MFPPNCGKRCGALAAGAGRDAGRMCALSSPPCGPAANLPHGERFALTAKRLFDGDRFMRGLAPVIRGERIEALVPERDLADLPRLAFAGAVIAPGFVDAQVNGCGGVMFNAALREETLDVMHAACLRGGCTAFLPTLVSTDDRAMRAAMALVAAYRARNGASPVMGLHLEGPYISLERRGIHDAAALRPLDAAMRKELAAFAEHTPLLLTVAPECVSDGDIRMLTKAGARVSLGHSAAPYERCMEAVAAGAVAVTHLYNAMPPLTGREPGLLGAAFDSRELWCGLIADGRHVHAASLRAAARLKKGRCCFVSDATAPAGSAPGEETASFSFCGQTVTVRDGRCVNADGTLGGSCLTMMEALRFGIERMGLEEAEALRMVSLYPARMLGQDGLFGRIAPGRTANLAVYAPASHDLRAVVDRGRVLGYRA